MKKKCPVPGCKTMVTPVRENRAYFPFCDAHADYARRVSVPQPTLSLHPVSSSPTLARAAYNRKHGANRMKETGE